MPHSSRATSPLTQTKTEEARLAVVSPEMRADVDMISIAKRAAEKEIWEGARWNIEYYVGQQFERRDEFLPIISNLFYSVVRVMVGALYDQNPKARVKPKLVTGEIGADPLGPENRELITDATRALNRRRREIGQAAEKLLEHTNRETELKLEVKRCIQATALAKRSAIRIGYNAVRGHTETKRGEGKVYVTPEMKSAHSGAVPEDENFGQESVKKERVWAKYLSPFRYFYAPEATVLTESPWLVIEYLQNVDDIKNNKNYDEKARRKIRATRTHATAFLEGARDFSARNFARSGVQARFLPQTSKFVIIQEIWDMKHQEVRVIAEGNEDLGYLRKRDWPFTRMEGYPIEELVFNPVMDQQWPRAEVDNLRGVQDQLNVLDDQTRDFYGRLLACILIKENAMDQEEVEKLMDSKFNEAIIYRGTAPSMFQGPTLSSEFFARRRELNEIAERESHLPEWLLVGRSMKARSATEAQALQQGVTAFVREKVGIIQDFVRKIYIKELQVMQEAYTIKQVIPIIGPMGLEWREFRVQSVKEELDVTIVPFSSLPVTPEVEKERLREMLQLAGITAETVPGLINMPMILRRSFERLDPNEDVDQFFNMEVLEQFINSPDQQRALGQQLAAAQAQQPQGGIAPPPGPPGA